MTVLPMSRRWKSVLEQSLVVPLVQADRWFIENVHYANQSGADLAGETNALRFSAGQAYLRFDSMTGNRDRRRSGTPADRQFP